MASAQQLKALIKSHIEGDPFFKNGHSQPLINFTPSNC
jgi:hypothetical protein